jgi:hypothetical protein
MEQPIQVRHDVVDAGECEFWVMIADPADTHLYLAGPVFWISTDGGAVFDRMPTTGNDRLPASGHGDYHGAGASLRRALTAVREF